MMGLVLADTRAQAEPGRAKGTIPSGPSRYSQGTRGSRRNHAPQLLGSTSLQTKPHLVEWARHTIHNTPVSGIIVDLMAMGIGLIPSLTSAPLYALHSSWSAKKTPQRLRPTPTIDSGRGSRCQAGRHPCSGTFEQPDVFNDLEGSFAEECGNALAGRTRGLLTSVSGAAAANQF